MGMTIDKDRAIEILTKCEVNQMTAPQELNYKIGEFDKARYTLITLAENYEARLKADKVAMLEEIQSEIEEESWDIGVIIPGPNKQVVDKEDLDRIIQEKINALEEKENGN